MHKIWAKLEVCDSPTFNHTNLQAKQPLRITRHQVTSPLHRTDLHLQWKLQGSYKATEKKKQEHLGKHISDSAHDTSIINSIFTRDAV